MRKDSTKRLMSIVGYEHDWLHQKIYINCRKRSLQKKKRLNRNEERSLSSQTVILCDDLLIQILQRLPIKSLNRFKLVSRYWFSLVSEHHFALRRLPNPNPALGLFYFLPKSNSFDYVPFDLRNNPTPTIPPFKNIIKSTENQNGVHILHSCNGFLLCSSFGIPESYEGYYHLYNPTTTQFTTFPKPRRCEPHLLDPLRLDALLGLTLVVDPAKSPHYRVVCVRALRPRRTYQIVIFSSETYTWRDSGEIFMDDLDTEFKEGVYWNGRVHWICAAGKKSSLLFHVEEEKLSLMPMPPFPLDWDSYNNINYFGESCNHLLMVNIYGHFQFQFNVYELKRDYSQWFVKYHVDLHGVANAFPVLLQQPGAYIYNYNFFISSIIITGGEIEEDAFLVLRIPSKVIRYNLLTQAFERLCDFEGGDKETYFNVPAFQYIESLCRVHQTFTFL